MRSPPDFFPNVSRLPAAPPQLRGLSSTSTQNQLASKGTVTLPSGVKCRRRVGSQGGHAVRLAHKADTPTAQCQAFCNQSSVEVPSMWCKCRACDFCPKGGEAIEEAAKATPTGAANAAAGVGGAATTSTSRRCAGAPRRVRGQRDADAPRRRPARQRDRCACALARRRRGFARTHRRRRRRAER